MPDVSRSPAVGALPAVMSPRRGIRLGPQWQALRGCAWGVRQATLTGHLLVAGGDWQLAQFDAFMLDLLDEAAPPFDGQPGPQAVAHRFLHWYGAVQRGQRVPVFGPGVVVALVSAGDATRFDVALPYHDTTAARRTLEWLALALTAFRGDPATGPASRARAEEALGPLLEMLRGHALSGTNNFYLVRAAHAQGVPCRTLLPATFSLGQGTRSRRLQSTVTDRTSAVAMQIAHSKSWTAHVLRLHGVPVPWHEGVADAEAAVKVALRLGYPVVVKPDDQEQGRGVSAGLADDSAVREAFAAARAFSGAVLVEKHHAGADYRLNVMQGEVIKILHRRPGAVDGDGIHTVAQLVELELQGPRLRRAVRQLGRRILDLDAEALSLLAEQGLAPEEVPGAGTRVQLRRKSNISTGGIQTLVPPAAAHQDNLDLAIDAVRAVGLDLGGVDMLLPDIARSWRESGGVVIEVNAKPQIGHSVGGETYDRIVECLMGGDGRVPVHLAIAADGESIEPEKLLALAQSLGCNGLATAEGVWIDGRQRAGASANAFDAARMVLLNETVGGAVCVVPLAEILASGLPFDRVTGVRVLGQPADAAARSALDRALAMVAANTENNRA